MEKIFPRAEPPKKKEVAATVTWQTIELQQPAIELYDIGVIEAANETGLVSSVVIAREMVGADLLVFMVAPYGFYQWKAPLGCNVMIPRSQQLYVKFSGRPSIGFKGYAYSTIGVTACHTWRDYNGIVNSYGPRIPIQFIQQ